MTKPLRCIAVGVRAKTRGGYMVDLLGRYPEMFQIAAFVDASRELAQEEATRRGWNELLCFGSLPDAVKHVPADACVITSPAKFHAEQMRTALVAGLHVYCAKPMTYGLGDAEQLVALAEKQHRCIVIDQQQQFTLTERTLAEWVRTEKYGKAGFVEMRVHRYRPEMRAFTGDQPFIWEQGVHSFNSLLAILGRPALSVYAHQMQPQWSTYNGPTVSLGVIEFAGGLPCHYLGTFDSRTTTLELRIEFERAVARFFAENSWTKRLDVALPGKNFEPAGIEDNQDTGPAERFNLEAFYRGATQGGRVPNDGPDNLRTLAVVDAFIRSSRTGQRENVRQFE